jgi:hypothetical protein
MLKTANGNDYLTSRSWLCIDGDSTSSSGSSAAADGYLQSHEEMQGLYLLLEVNLFQ